MAYKVISTLRFEISVQKTSLWINEVWSAKSADKFEQKVSAAITRIANNPGTGRLSAKKNVRSVLVTNHNRLYYRVNGKVITLLLLFETKQNPRRNKFD
jgi:plasmid stabilization system protein ParE